MGGSRWFNTVCASVPPHKTYSLSTPTVVQRRVAPVVRPLKAEVPRPIRLRQLLQVLQVPVARRVQHRQPDILVAGLPPLRRLLLLLGLGLWLLRRRLLRLGVVLVGHFVMCVVATARG